MEIFDQLEFACAFPPKHNNLLLYVTQHDFEWQKNDIDGMIHQLRQKNVLEIREGVRKTIQQKIQGDQVNEINIKYALQRGEIFLVNQHIAI